MLNQTFMVLFESLFINELGQAGEGKVWFKTKPIEEWIAENTPPISEQPISFMDFEPGTTVFPVVITGIVVLPNGQVTVVTPNGTFLADTTLIPRPVLKPTLLEDKNGNQFIVHPDGTVTALGQAGFIPKPMTAEEKLDKIRRGLYLEALKDYKTQIETYYTSKNEPIPTRGPRNHNKNIIIDLPECIGTEANEIKDNFLAIKDNVNKKDLREKSLKRILGTSKKNTLDFIAQKALDSLMKTPNTNREKFQQFLASNYVKIESDTICSELSSLSNFRVEDMKVYLYPSTTHQNFSKVELEDIAMRIQKLFNDDNALYIKVFVNYDKKFPVNTNISIHNPFSEYAEQNPRDCHLVLTLGGGVAYDYLSGATQGALVADNVIVKIPPTISTVIVSSDSIPFYRTLHNGDTIKINPVTHFQRKHVATFGASHEIWHQLMEKTRYYLINQSDFI